MAEFLFPNFRVPEILAFPNPTLNQEARSVERMDEEIRSSIIRMVLSLRRSSGAGIAAPQIGVLRRIFIIKPHPSSMMEFFINPTVTPISQERTDAGDEASEGCLSVPGIRVRIERFKSVSVKYHTLDWSENENFSEGWRARVIQHEYDHLNGILITSPRI